MKHTLAHPTVNLVPARPAYQRPQVQPLGKWAAVTLQCSVGFCDIGFDRVLNPGSTGPGGTF